jgi:hypothetical protein
VRNVNKEEDITMMVDTTEVTMGTKIAFISPKYKVQLEIFHVKLGGIKSKISSVRAVKLIVPKLVKVEMVGRVDLVL